MGDDDGTTWSCINFDTKGWISGVSGHVNDSNGLLTVYTVACDGNWDDAYHFANINSANSDKCITSPSDTQQWLSFTYRTTA